MMRNDIQRLDAANYDRARRALSRAFYNYRLMVYATADDRRRASGVDSLYGAILADCFRLGDVYVTPEFTGAACWLPPGTPTANLMRQIRSGMLALPFRFGLTGFARLLPYEAMAQKLHHQYATEPHWYLAAIGVEPEEQGKGNGGALMQPILARADAEGLPCYLETHVETNVRLYQKHGFEIRCRSDVAGHPIPVWAMLRPSRAKSG